MSKTRKLTIRIPVDLYEYAKAKADDKGISLSQEVIDIIQTHKRVEDKVKADTRKAANEHKLKEVDDIIAAMKTEPLRPMSHRVLAALGFRR